MERSHTHRLEKLILLNSPYYPKNIQIQCKPYQNINNTFHRTGRKNPENFIETQRMKTSQGKL